MKLLLTPDEFQKAVEHLMKQFPVFGARKVVSVDVPGKYATRSEVVIVFEDEDFAEVEEPPAPLHLPHRIPESAEEPL